MGILWGLFEFDPRAVEANNASIVIASMSLHFNATLSAAKDFGDVRRI